MKKIFFIIVILLYVLHANAKHVAGGELFYEYIGPGSTANTNSYRVTLRLFRDCASTGPQLESENVVVGIYDGNALIQTLPLFLNGGISTISLNTASFPCLIGSVSVCYQIALYVSTVELRVNATGYTLSRLGCCRIDNISNLTQNSVGSNYVTFIPGTNTLPSGHNSSPQYKIKDTTLVCANKKFSLDFSAEDADGDSLSYTFCDAYTAANRGQNQPPPSILSLIPVPYGGGFTGSEPMGSNVTINPVTGIISGIAPYAGQYVVNVCIAEFRNGSQIGFHRKDFILKVQSCDLIDAQLPDKIVNCKNFSVYFENQSTSSSITSYLWTVGDPGNLSFTSTAPTFTYVYPDTGRFVAHLTITGPKGCVGSDSTTVLVYPGFVPDFTVQGDCFLNPFQFTDQTKAKYGVVNNWRWNFGDNSTTADTSHLKDPSYTYQKGQIATAILVTGTDKGCIDTVQKNVIVYDNPPVQLPFRDTLICSIDTLQLMVKSIGAYSWLPDYNIINPNTANPLVYPKNTATYYVTVNYNGCTGKDSVKVSVLDFITVKINPDTTVCLTDTFRLHPVSDALGYRWSPSAGLDNPDTKYPLLHPPATMQYQVIANLGKCQDTAVTLVKADPYPFANAGTDTAICFGTKVQLNGAVMASSFLWTPNKNMLDATTLHPIVAPAKSTRYILTVRYDTGCVKPVSDSVLVATVPAVKVFAGRDTAIVINQALQLNASSNYDTDTGAVYVWLPDTGLNNAGIPNPVTVLQDNIDSIKYTVRVTLPQGCFGADDIWVKVFKTGPDIFVPSAFTPNNDGKNDILKPVTVGITTLEYFSIYNRWGQLLYSTNETGKGWDGTANGSVQQSGTYVYITQGSDYTGKKVFRKGTVVLIR